MANTKTKPRSTSAKSPMEALEIVIEGLNTPLRAKVNWHVPKNDAKKGHRSVVTVDFGYTYPHAYLNKEEHTSLVDALREAVRDYIGDKERAIQIHSNVYLGLMYSASVAAV